MTASIWNPVSSVVKQFDDSLNILYVTDYGAAGDGIVDDTAALLAAGAAVTAHTKLVFPPGRYRLTAPINIAHSDVVIEGCAATIDATALTYDPAVRASGAVFRFTGGSTLSTLVLVDILAGTRTIEVADGTIFSAGDLVRIDSTEILYVNGTTEAHFIDLNKVIAVSANTVTLEVPVKLSILMSGGHTVTIRTLTPLRNIHVTGLTFIGGGLLDAGLAIGHGQCGVAFLGVDICSVTKCRFEAFQGIAVFTDYAHNILVDTTTFEGFPSNLTSQAAADLGFYAVFVLRGRNAVTSNLVGTRVRHLVDGSEWFSLVESNCVANYTSRAAFGSHEEVFDLVIDSCIAIRCRTACVIRAFSASVSNCTFEGDTAGISTSVMLANQTFGELSISDCSIKTSSLTNPAIAITGCYTPLRITNNKLWSGLEGVQLVTEAIVGAIISDNEYTGIGSGTVVRYPTTSLNRIEDLTIKNNIARDYTGNVVTLRGSQLITAPADNIHIEGNIGYPVFNGSGNAVLLRAEGYYGDHIVIRGNLHYGDASAVVSVAPGELWRLKSHPTIEHNDDLNTAQWSHMVVGRATGPTLGANATLRRGSIIENFQASVTEPSGWMVTDSGTEGSFVGVTGDITATFTTLTLTGNAADKVFPGSYIDIPGAGVAGATLTVQVLDLSVDLTTATVSTAATTTVVGAVIARHTPSLESISILGAGGGGGGVTDHGLLTGLADDDHVQYLNNTRGDARYLQLTDVAESVDDRVGSLLVAGTGIALSYNDVGNTLTITNTVSGGGAGTGDVLQVDLTNAAADNAKGTAQIGHHVLAGTPPYVRPLRDHLRERVLLSDFGALGFPATDQAVWDIAINYMQSTGGILELPAGVIFLDKLNLGGISDSFAIIGQGPERTILIAKGDQTAIESTGQFSSLHLEGFTLDCQWNLIGSTDPVAAATANHGISIRDIGGTYAANVAGRLVLKNIVVQNYKNSGILLFSNTPGVFKQFLIENCHVYGGFDYLGSPGPVTNNGILLENVQDSVIQNCTARNIRGAPGYGIQLKNTCYNCRVDTVASYNCVGGVIFGYTTGTGVRDSRISNAVAIRCDNGFDAREAQNNSIHFSLIDQQGVGSHAFQFGTNCRVNAVRLDVVKNVGSNLRVANVGTSVEDCTIEIGDAIECNVGGDRFLVQYSSTSGHNITRLARYYTATGPQRIPGTATRGGVDSGTATTNGYVQLGYAMVEYSVIFGGSSANLRNSLADGIMVDTETGAGTLSFIDGTGSNDGRVITVRIGSSARPITVLNVGSNIRLAGSNFLMDNNNDVLTLRWNQTFWCEVSRSNNS